ncbi:hypothetical protein IAU60_005843 [Kwoniella sp. DSM 27419]
MSAIPPTAPSVAGYVPASLRRKIPGDGHRASEQAASQPSETTSTVRCVPKYQYSFCMPYGEDHKTTVEIRLRGETTFAELRRAIMNMVESKLAEGIPTDRQKRAGRDQASREIDWIFDQVFGKDLDTENYRQVHLTWPDAKHPSTPLICWTPYEDDVLGEEQWITKALDSSDLHRQIGHLTTSRPWSSSLSKRDTVYQDLESQLRKYWSENSERIIKDLPNPRSEAELTKTFSILAGKESKMYWQSRDKDWYQKLTKQSSGTVRAYRGTGC